MTKTIESVRLRRTDEDWQDYVDYLSGFFKEPQVNQGDYENFHTYYAALKAINSSVGAANDVNILRALVASLRATDCPELHELTIEYYGSGDSGEIVEIVPNRARQDNDYCRPSSDEVIQHELDRDLNEALDEYGWSLAYNLNPGFEISDGVADGGHGIVRITYNKATENWDVDVEHTQRIIESNEYSYSFT